MSDPALPSLSGATFGHDSHRLTFAELSGTTRRDAFATNHAAWLGFASALQCHASLITALPLPR